MAEPPAPRIGCRDGDHEVADDDAIAPDPIDHRMVRHGAQIVSYAHAHGLLLLTAGTYGNVVRFLPPLSISDELLTEGLGILRDAVAAVR